MASTDPPYLNEYEWWALLVGFVGVGWVAHLLVSATSKAMLQNLGDANHAWAWHPRFIGVIERALYTFSWLVGKPEFAGLWLALKVAGRWSHWDASDGKCQGQASGRERFNVFLLGNGLSLAFGIVGGITIPWLNSHMWWHAAAATTAGAALAAAVWYAAASGARGEVLRPAKPSSVACQTLAILAVCALLLWLLHRHTPSPR